MGNIIRIDDDAADIINKRHKKTNVSKSKIVSEIIKNDESKTKKNKNK